MKLGEKRPYKEAVFRNGVRPFVEFWAFDENLKTLKKKQIICPKSERPRLKSWAAETVKKINELLKDGFHFIDEKKTFNNKVSKSIIEEINDAIEIKKKVLRKRTIDTYLSSSRKIEEFLYFKKNLLLMPNQLYKSFGFEFCDYLKSTGLANKTVNNILENVNNLIGFIEKRGIEVVKFSYTKLPETETESNKAFEAEHLKTINDYLIDFEPNFYVLTQFMYHTFVRPRELRSLKISDIDLINRQLIVKGEISKNRKRETVPLNETILKILQKYIQNKDKNFYLFGNAIDSGKNIASLNTFYRKNRQILEFLDLFKFGYTLYSWKHTGVCSAFTSGLNIKQLQIILRHSSIQITDIYLKSLSLNQHKELLKGW